MNHGVRVSLPTLAFDYHHDRIVVTKLTPDADVGDPSDGLMFIGPRCESWLEGPNWIDKDGKEDHSVRWIKDSDTGWVHYFNPEWTEKERRETFAKYVVNYVYDERVTLPTETMCLDEHCVAKGDKPVLYFTPMWTTENRLEAYWRCVEMYLVKLF